MSYISVVSSGTPYVPPAEPSSASSSAPLDSTVTDKGAPDSVFTDSGDVYSEVKQAPPETPVSATPPAALVSTQMPMPIPMPGLKLAPAPVLAPVLPISPLPLPVPAQPSLTPSPEAPKVPSNPNKTVLFVSAALVGLWALRKLSKK